MHRSCRRRCGDGFRWHLRFHLVSGFAGGSVVPAESGSLLTARHNRRSFAGLPTLTSIELTYHASPLAEKVGHISDPNYFRTYQRNTSITRWVVLQSNLSFKSMQYIMHHGTSDRSFTTQICSPKDIRYMDILRFSHYRKVHAHLCYVRYVRRKEIPSNSTKMALPDKPRTFQLKRSTGMIPSPRS
jgi:hypothetical protein